MKADKFINPYYFSKRKRLLDVVLSLAGIFITLPILLLVGFLIKLLSPGGAIFTQKRAGKGNKPFVIYKFRTMKIDAAKEQAKYLKLNTSPFPTFKVENDPRFIGIGKFLSKVGLDELPQLVNVLKGDMSFIGPRPFPLNENELLPKQWKFRTRVRPGIFSPAIIANRSSMTTISWSNTDRELLSRGSWGYDLRMITEAILKLLAPLFRMKSNQLLVFLLTLAIVLSVIIFGQHLTAKKEYLEAYILGSSGDWWYDTPRPPHWLVDSIDVGDIESSTGRRTEAQVLGIKTYQDGPSKLVLLKVKLLVTKNKKTGVSRYKQKPVEIGSTIVLSLNNTRFGGSVVSIDGHKGELATKTITLRLKLYDLYPWFVDQVNVGDVQQDDLTGETSVTILEKRVTLAEKTATNDAGQLLARHDPLKRDLEIVVSLTVYAKGEDYFYAFIQPVKVGNELWLEMPEYNLSKAHVISIREEE